MLRIRLSDDDAGMAEVPDVPYQTTKMIIMTISGAGPAIWISGSGLLYDI
jgi:hypothetical protein